VPGKELYMIQSPKFILIIAWNPSGFHVVDVLPKEQKLNTEYYMSAILQSFVA
jgi:hypothetical protein